MEAQKMAHTSFRRIAHQDRPVCCAGTVIPAPPNEPFLYLSPDVSAFRKRATTPTGGEGHFVQVALAAA